MITAAICLAVVVGAVISRGLDRFEGWVQTRRDEARYAASWQLPSRNDCIDPEGGEIRFVRSFPGQGSARIGAGRDGEK